MCRPYIDWAQLETHVELTLWHLHWLSQLVHVVLIPETHTILPSLKINDGWIFLNDTKFINTCSFTIHYKKFNACPKTL